MIDILVAKTINVCYLIFYMLFDSTYLVMLYLVTQCYFWLLSESVFKLSVICASESCVELR